MKWYFALNAASIQHDPMYSNCVEAAVLSALQNTSLSPHFLFDGPACDFTDRLQRLGVTIIRRESSLADAIAAAKPDEPHWQQIARGAYLRLEIPAIDHESEYVLYTDCDVLFLREPTLESVRPRLFAVAPEFARGDFENMNSGVMVMNLAGMRSVADEFAAFIRQGIGEFHAFDQGALRLFFAGQYEPLPEVLNWKPYWGLNPEAEIIHFHGPKPPQVRKMLQDGQAAFPEILWNLLTWNRETYVQLEALWHSYLARAQGLR